MVSLSGLEGLHWKAIGNAAVARWIELLALRQTLVVWLNFRGGGDSKSAEAERCGEQQEGSKVLDHGLEERKADAGSPLPRVCNAREAAVGQVKHAPASVGAAIIDGHHHAFPIVIILYKELGAQWKVGVGGSHAIGIEALSTGSALSVVAIANPVVGGFAALMRRRLCLGSQGSKQQERKKETMHQKGIVTPEAFARLRAKVFSLSPMGCANRLILHICYRVSWVTRRGVKCYYF